MPTKDKLYISVDLFARWRITDPLQYFLRLRDERSAQSRLDDILGSETRNAVAKHDLIELIRTTKDRVPLRDASLDGRRTASSTSACCVPIQKGRQQIEQEIIAAAAAEAARVRHRAARHPLQAHQLQRERAPEDLRPHDQRAPADRRALPLRGQRRGRAILGNKERDLNMIQSEAYRKVEEIRGEADAKATEIYAAAYNQSPEAVQFYEFIRTMDAYKSIIADNTTLVLSTDSDLFKFLKGMTPERDSAR